MSDTGITAIVMPKWGLSMSEGRVGDWIADVGEQVNVGDDILDVETDKIASSVEATQAGVLRRKVGQFDQVIPVGGLLGVLADPDISDGDIDAFIEDFQANFVPEEADQEDDAQSAYATITIGTTRLRYLQQGNGEQNILLIHGFGGDIDNWLFNINDLSAKATVYALDLPGHGQSSKDVSDGSLGALAGQVVDFMNEVDCSLAHLVGHSLGGAVAQQIAIDHAQHVKSLSLIASAGIGDEINQTYIDGFIQSNSRRQLKPFVQSLFADMELVNRQMIDDILKYKRLDNANQALQVIADANFVEGKQQSLPLYQLMEAGFPLQIIWGREDKIIPVSHASTCEQKCPVKIIADAGHMVHMEASSEVNNLLIEFMKL